MDNKEDNYKLSIQFSKKTGYFDMKHLIKNVEISCIPIEVFIHDGFIEPFGCHYLDLSTFAKQILSPQNYKIICTKHIKKFDKEWYYDKSDNSDWFYINVSICNNKKEVRWGLHCSCPGDENPIEIFYLIINYNQLTEFSKEITAFVETVHDMYNASIEDDKKDVPSDIEFMLKSIPEKYLINEASVDETISKAKRVVRDDSGQEDGRVFAEDAGRCQGNRADRHGIRRRHSHLPRR